jgi:hypothetical protein
MKKCRAVLFAFAALLALYCAPALPGVRAARADWGQGAASYEEPGGNWFKRLIKNHPLGAGAGALAAIVCLFAVIMGPADLFDAWLRVRRGGRPIRDIERDLGSESEADRILDDIDDARRKD